MSIQTIYARLVQAGMSPESACGMMGNMQEESAMRANNAQDGFSQFSDEVYTSYADRGLIDFIGDSIGYGLCQWTLASRKRKMLDFHRQRGVSIGHEDTQVDFCIWELQNEPEYRKLWEFLKVNKGVCEAADRICREYERPAVNNVDARAASANNFYMMLGGMDVENVPILGPDNAPTGEPEDAIFHTPAGGIGTGDPSPTMEGPSQSATLTAQPEARLTHVPVGEPNYWPPRVLAYGMYGPDVVALQGLLIAHGYPAGISGTFDNATDKQLRAWQGTRGLKADGIAGNKSWTAILKR